jgi:hypothetical protein
MHFSEYQHLAMRTRGKYNSVNAQSACALLGLAGKTGEYIDLQKKMLFHDKPIEVRDQMQEMGDILWYLALECDAKGWSLDTIAGLNIEKLKKRYPDGFSTEAANAPRVN